MEDLVIIGAGPAGLAALLYANLYGLSALCIGKPIGGKLLTAPFIIDYPGIEGISGKDFVTLQLSQIQKTNGRIIEQRVSSITPEQQNNQTMFTVTTENGTKQQAKTVLIATGNMNKQSDKGILEIVNGLGLESRNGLLVVNPSMTTDVLGVFAAGDCIVYPFSLEQLATAVSTAITAAGSMYEYLKSGKPPILWGNTKIPRMTVNNIP